MSDKTATLTNDQTGQSIKLNILEATDGPDVIDIRPLYKETGMFTHDPGFTSTSSCDSKITYIDGEKGILRYRGYDIGELAENCTFMEVAYLLIYGELPNKQQKEWFESDIAKHSLVHEQIHHFFRGFRRDAHPMAVMCGAVGGLSAFHNAECEGSMCDIVRPQVTHMLIAKVATLAAMTFKYNKGEPFVYPRADLRYSENFVNMCFSNPTADYKVSPTVARAMRKLFILHADHEQNASTSTVRLSGSSGANPFACIAAGIASLWGPSHGGANQEVLEMLAEIGSVDRIPEFLERAKDKDDPFKLMGFGHRVYRNYDPRASVIREDCHKILDELGIREEPRLKLAMALEKIALEDPYFVERKLFPNVDFYSGIILSALGFPPSMFTVLFAVARTVGWIAQWKEMIEDPAMKIGRPRQRYIGEPERKFVPLDKRK